MSYALFMGMAGKNIIENRKEGAKEMQKTEEFCVDESGWIHCPLDVYKRQMYFRIMGLS